LIEWEHKYAAQTYHPIPVVFDRAEGVHVWDPEGRRYYDFLSAYSAVNQGHCHPAILEAMVNQSKKLTLSSRAFYNSIFPKYSKFITEVFGYDRVLPMNTGAETVDTGIKLARRWGYRKKGIPEGQALVITAMSNFHGRTFAAISTSTDPNSVGGFGPLLQGYHIIPYNNVQALEEALAAHGPRVCGFMVEPIQGEAGVVVPTDGYLASAYKACKKHNVLFMADEVQTGLCRTGRMLACDWEGVRPDILQLGKALSGGFHPVSAVLADDHIMSVLDVGSHGSTFGGNPVAAAVGIASLKVLIEEKLAENAELQGNHLRKGLNALKGQFPFIQTIRGKGLLNAIVVDPQYKKKAWDLCMLFKKRGLLAKPTHDHIIRLAPPLVITQAQIDECLTIMQEAMQEFGN